MSTQVDQWQFTQTDRYRMLLQLSANYDTLLAQLAALPPGDPSAKTTYSQTQNARYKFFFESKDLLFWEESHGALLQHRARLGL